MKWKVIHYVSILPQSICLAVIEWRISLTAYERQLFCLCQPLRSLVIVNKCFFPACLSQMDFHFECLSKICFPLSGIEYWLSFAGFLGLTAEGLLVWCHVQSCALPLSMALKLQGICLHKCSARGYIVQLFYLKNENLLKSSWCWQIIDFSSFLLLQKRPKPITYLSFP